MATLRFGISKTDHEWQRLEQLINSKNNGKPPLKGSGMSRFIHQEMNRSFKGKVTECPGERSERLRKEFAISFSDELAERITCEANRLGISVGEFIEKKIIDPHLEAPISPQ